MKGKLLSVLITVLLLTIVFSGCLENPNNILQGDEYTTLSDGTKVTGDFDKVEILNYSVETLDGQIKIADGFVYSENATRFNIRGTARNIAGELIRIVRITAKYYTEDDNYIQEYYNAFSGIRAGDKWIFNIGFRDENNLAYVHYVVFDISIIEIGNISEDGESDRFVGTWQNILDNNITHYFSKDGDYAGVNKSVINETISGDWILEEGKLIINAEYEYINSEIKFNLTYNYAFSENDMVLTLINESNETQIYEHKILDT